MTWKEWKKTIRAALEAADLDLETADIAYLDVASGEDLMVARDNDMIGVTTIDDN